MLVGLIDAITNSIYAHLWKLPSLFLNGANNPIFISIYSGWGGGTRTPACPATAGCLTSLIFGWGGGTRTPACPATAGCLTSLIFGWLFGASPLLSGNWTQYTFRRGMRQMGQYKKEKLRNGTLIYIC